MINKLAKEIHKNANSKGFYDEPKNIGEMLMLIVTEVAEACEADREGKFSNVKCFEAFSDFNRPSHDAFSFESTIKNTFEDELADIMIRVMDLAAFKGIDLEYHIKMKMAYNAMREYKHGKKY